MSSMSNASYVRAAGCWRWPASGAVPRAAGAHIPNPPGAEDPLPSSSGSTR
jgi:hypothetical protein